MRRRTTRNPATSDLLLVAGLGVAGFAAYRLARGGELPRPVQELVYKLAPRVAMPARCFDTGQGNTKLTLLVQPQYPLREVGARVIYAGQLLGASPVGRILDVYTGDYIGAGKTIEFWDPLDCSDPFLTATTDENGFYTVSAPLGPSELNGYFVYAYFRGERAILGLPGWDASITPVLRVTPVEASGTSSGGGGGTE